MITFQQLNAKRVVIPPNDKKLYMCYICEWFIVVPPVHFNPLGGYICGFCYQERKHFLKNDEALQPQKLYEDIGIYLRFPCKFCEFFTVFNGPASMHEIQCSKRIFDCPVSKVNRWFLGEGENCDWQDNDGKSMVAHVKENHKDKILSRPSQIRFSDIKISKSKKHIYVVILNNRKIISITSENDEENKCIIFRCRSNKFGHPDVNYRCKVEFKSESEYIINQQDIRVFPLGARIMEKSSDYCSVPVDSLDEKTVFNFSFSPCPPKKDTVPDPRSDCYDDAGFEFQC